MSINVVQNTEHLVSTDDIILGLFGMTTSELAVDIRKNKDTKYKDWFRPKEESLPCEKGMEKTTGIVKYGISRGICVGNKRM